MNNINRSLRLSLRLDTTRGTLERNFAVVGDDGSLKEPPTVNTPNYSPVLMKESEHVFSLWCSGRTGCQGLLIDLKVCFFNYMHSKESL